MISERVRTLRREQGLKQEEMAEKIGIAYRTYQDLEGGKKPSYDTLLKTAEANQVSVDWILGRTEDRELHQL